jgi:hypothetical protein
MRGRHAKEPNYVKRAILSAILTTGVVIGSVLAGGGAGAATAMHMHGHHHAAALTVAKHMHMHG